MGKAARERARRKAEAEAPAKLILPPKTVAAESAGESASGLPTPSKTSTAPTSPSTASPQSAPPGDGADFPAQLCAVCSHALGLERFPTPDGGVVWLCGGCGARVKADAERAGRQEDMTDELVELCRPMLEYRVAKEAKLYGATEDARKTLDLSTLRR